LAGTKPKNQTIITTAQQRGWDGGFPALHRHHWFMDMPLGQAHSWDRPTLGTCHWYEPSLRTGPLLGQAHSWDRPTLGTGPLLGQAHSWDRPILGTGPPV
jgi:hypothetical protein